MLSKHRYLDKQFVYIGKLVSNTKFTTTYCNKVRIPNRKFKQHQAQSLLGNMSCSSHRVDCIDLNNLWCEESISQDIGRWEMYAESQTPPLPPNLVRMKIEENLTNQTSGCVVVCEMEAAHFALCLQDLISCFGRPGPFTTEINYGKIFISLNVI